MAEAAPVRLQATGEPHRYRVLLDGDHVGDVWRVRFPGSWTMRPGAQGFNDDGYGVGHWGWVADTAPEDEYPTRREAVDDMRAIREHRR